jgi:hypothetical protein
VATLRRSVRRTVVGALAGGAFGYYLGAKAGRARYEEINRLVSRVGGLGQSGTAVKKARALADLSLERVRATASRLPGPLRSSPARPPEAEPGPAD